MYNVYLVIERRETEQKKLIEKHKKGGGMNAINVLIGLAIFIALINISFYLRKLNETAEDVKKLLSKK